jgi:hypothetical protein
MHVICIYTELGFHCRIVHNFFVCLTLSPPPIVDREDRTSKVKTRVQVERPLPPLGFVSDGWTWKKKESWRTLSMSREYDVSLASIVKRHYQVSTVAWCRDVTCDSDIMGYTSLIVVSRVDQHLANYLHVYTIVSMSHGTMLSICEPGIHCQASLSIYYCLVSGFDLWY